MKIRFRSHDGDPNKDEAINSKTNYVTVLAILSAIREKMEVRQKDTTLSLELLDPIYNDQNREVIRKKWRTFIREIWLVAVPVNNDGSLILVKGKNLKQTVMFAQDLIANLLCEHVFFNMFSNGICTSPPASLFQSFRIPRTSHNVNIYNLIPTPNCKFC